MIHRAALPPQLRGYATVAVMAMFHGDPLDVVPEAHLLGVWFGGGPRAIITGAAHPCQPAHSFDREFAFEPVYFADLLVDPGPEVSSRFRRRSSMRSKAPLKKSSPKLCRATSASNSFTLRSPFESASVGSAGWLPEASSFHWYSHFRRMPSSRASWVTLAHVFIFSKASRRNSGEYFRHFRHIGVHRLIHCVPFRRVSKSGFTPLLCPKAPS